MSEKLDVLVVEDEEPIRNGLCDVLAYHGYVPTGVGTGEDGLREALTERYALIILDLMLPGISGYDVCEAVREQSPTQPILMLTARGSEEDVLEGFRRGADDYVTKPFSVSELMARARALMRRVEPPEASTADESFEFGPWVVRTAEARARVGEKSVELTPREISILELFEREAGRIVSRRLLLREVWGFSNPEKIETRSVDMQIGKLRKKLDHDGTPLIETVRGAGYRYGSGEP